MTRLYVPSIGEEFELAEDWTFDLYPEKRNQNLPSLLGLDYQYSYLNKRTLSKENFEFFSEKFGLTGNAFNCWIATKTFESIKNIFNEYDAKRNEVYDLYQEKWESKNRILRNYQDYDSGLEREYDKHGIPDLFEKSLQEKKELIKQNQSSIFDVLKVTLPAGTVLKLDRIYIRKGNSEYDSLSFFIKRYGKDGEIRKTSTNSKGSLRFWSKLDDCNKMYLNL